MKYSVYILLFFGTIIYGQKISIDNPDYNCKRTQNSSFTKLASNFPLNKTCKIQIVSFEYAFVIDDTGNKNLNLSIDSLPRIGNKLVYKSLKEYKYLEFPKIIELCEILYNVNYDPKKDKTVTPVGCYMPRNAIVFLDNEDNIVEFIEMCFECGGHHVFNKSNFGDFCTGKTQLLKEFFISNGMKYHLLKE